MILKSPGIEKFELRLGGFGSLETIRMKIVWEMGLLRRAFSFSPFVLAHKGKTDLIFLWLKRVLFISKCSPFYLIENTLLLFSQNCFHLFFRGDNRRLVKPCLASRKTFLVQTQNFCLSPSSLPFHPVSFR